MSICIIYAPSLSTAFIRKLMNDCLARVLYKLVHSSNLLFLYMILNFTNISHL